jgi:ketosteroid isomerase-like protein
MGANGDIIKGIYAAFARGDVGAVLAVLDPAIQWYEAESLRIAAGNPYVGPPAVATGVFMTLVGQVDDFAIAPGNIIDGGDMVAAEGRYTGTVKKTGTKIDAQFVHVFELRGGKVVRFQQYTDTLQWETALGAP